MKIKQLCKILAAPVCALALLLTLAPAAQAAGFSDVPSTHWAYQAIQDASASGITSGYADGSFHPGDEVTCAQFTAFLARAFYGSPVQSTSSPWYQVYLDAVSGDKVLSGDAAAGKAEALQSPLNRYDMALMMYRVMSAKGSVPGESERKAAQQKLSDWNAIPAQYREAVASCVAAGTLNGMSDGTFSGSKPMNRAQACAVISRMGLSPAPEASLSELRTGLAKLINAERTKNGLKTVAVSDKLDSAAQTLLGEVLQGFYDNRPDGRSWGTAITDAGFQVSSSSSAVQLPIQNCATAAEAMAYIRKTPDVLSEVLNSGCTHIGIGYLKSGGDGYQNCWSVLLIGSASAQPAKTSQAASPQAACAELVKLINAQRSQAGLKALGTTDQLSAAAQVRAKDLSGGYIEFRADGSEWSSVLEKNNVSASYVDESFVVGIGYDTAALALQKALATDSAKAAMLSREFTHLGVGYVHDANGYGGYQDFWSLLYITAENAPGSPAASTGTGSLTYTPVPMKDLVNKKSLQRKATDDQLAQAYAEAAKLVEPFVGLSLEQKLQGICEAVRDRFDNNGMSYTMQGEHYNDPYGYFIEGAASCAGCTRATGLCLNILGIPYEHVHENQYTHQWCRVNVNGTYWICDPYGLYCGPEPAPYVHANPLLN